jgi:hypothetical protein
MGLDMYLHKCNRTEHTAEQLNEIDNRGELTPESEEAKPFLPLRKYEFMDAYSIFREAGYWRKANAIHNWFVKCTQNGVDECQLTELDQEQLSALLETCERVKASKDATELPPVSGFFFGSTEVDEWYWRDIDQTIAIIQNVLNETDWEKERVFYNSSW